MAKLFLHEEIESNKRNSFVVFCLAFFVYLFYGFLFFVFLTGNENVLFPPLFLSLILVSYFYYARKGIILNHLPWKWREINLKDVKERHVFNTASSLISAFSPEPLKLRVIVVEEESINAFAISDGKEAVVGVTSGAIKKLNREEIEGVIAHEVSHIIAKDSEFKTILLALLSAFSLLSYFARHIRITGRRRRGSIYVGYFVLSVLGILLLILMHLLFAKYSRERELMADANAVRMLRNNNGLISALEKIKREKVGEIPASFNFLLFSHGRSRFFDLFATHPPLEERIERLKQL